MMTTEHKAVHQTITEFLIKILRQRIIQGHINFDTPIDQIAISKEFNVSKSPIRDALMHLQGEGLVLCHPRKTVVVKQVTASEINEIYTLKIQLETQLLANSIKQISSHKLNQANELINQLHNKHSEAEFMHSISNIFSYLYSGVEQPQTYEFINLLNIKISRFERLLYANPSLRIAKAECFKQLISLCLERKVQLACKHLTQQFISNKNAIYLALMQKQAS